MGGWWEGMVIWSGSQGQREEKVKDLSLTPRH